MVGMPGPWRPKLQLRFRLVAHRAERSSVSARCNGGVAAQVGPRRPPARSLRLGERGVPTLAERARCRAGLPGSVGLKLGREGFEVGAGDGRAVEVREFFAVGNRLDFLAKAFRDSFETDLQRFEDVLLLGEDQTLLATFLTTFLAELFGE